jgi:hypothetical protein
VAQREAPHFQRRFQRTAAQHLEQQIIVPAKREFEKRVLEFGRRKETADF